MRNFEQWNEIMKEENYQTFLNPLATQGKDAYNLSGYRDAKNIQDKIIRYKKDTNTILDFGCGDGRILQHFPKNFNVIGIDAASNTLEKAKELHPENVFYLCGEYGDSKYVNKFDVIYSITVFIHMTIADGINVIENLKSKLKPGGLFIVDIPIYEEATDDGKWLGVTCWSEAQFREMAKNNDFEILDINVNPGKMIWPNLGPVHGLLNILKYEKD